MLRTVQAPSASKYVLYYKIYRCSHFSWVGSPKISFPFVSNLKQTVLNWINSCVLRDLCIAIEPTG